MPFRNVKQCFSKQKSILFFRNGESSKKFIAQCVCLGKTSLARLPKNCTFKKVKSFSLGESL